MSLVLTAALFVLLIAPNAEAAGERKSPGYFEAAFTPDCRDLLIREIEKARKSIRIAIFLITDRKVVAAIRKARMSGVDVEVKYSADNHERYERMQEAIQTLEKASVRCVRIEIPGTYKKMHHKFVVIDKRVVLTGSYNFSVTAAEDSYENFVMIESRKIAEQYTLAFAKIQSED